MYPSQFFIQLNASGDADKNESPSLPLLAMQFNTWTV